MQSLYDKLKDYMNSDYIPFHMPGHKRNYEKFGLEQAAGVDITEIDGFDDYHYPQGIIKEIEEQAAMIYGSDTSFYLVNGSSVGILSAISAAAMMQEMADTDVTSYESGQNSDNTIIVARNSHKAVYNAVYINNLHPEYIYPEIDEENGIMCGISPQEVSDAIKRTGAKTVVITSPTYEGVVSDVRAIADVCHRMGAVLIVDEAHGAHFNYNEEFPKTAVSCGADIVIESIHKTLPCYTQTAILHVLGERIDIALVKRFLSIYQTSSPSYIFMAGMNRCIDYMVSVAGRQANTEYVNRLKTFRNKLSGLKNIRLYELPDVYRQSGMAYDISKIVLMVPGRGVQLYETLLEKYHIQLEMAASDYVIAMTSIGDDFDWYEKMIIALEEIDDSFEITKKGSKKAVVVKARVAISPRKALTLPDKEVKLTESPGQIAKECVYAYPPGIPLIYPGEEITEDIITAIECMKNTNIVLKGFQDEKGETILCIK